jgi:hypothetical protein
MKRGRLSTLTAEAQRTQRVEIKKTPRSQRLRGESFFMKQ